MSVRSDRADVSMKMDGMQLGPQSAAMSGDVEATISAAQQADSALSDANAFNTANPEHPLTRNLVVSIRSSLAELCLRKNKAVWAPSGEALKAIFQCAAALKHMNRTNAVLVRRLEDVGETEKSPIQFNGRHKKFTDLNGTQEMVSYSPLSNTSSHTRVKKLFLLLSLVCWQCGDLKSIVRPTTRTREVLLLPAPCSRSHDVGLAGPPRDDAREPKVDLPRERRHPHHRRRREHLLHHRRELRQHHHSGGQLAHRHHLAEGRRLAW